MKNNKEKLNLNDKIDIALGIISTILSGLAIVISTWSVLKTNETSRQIVSYQLEQERLPKVAALNYNLPISLGYLDTFEGQKIDFSCMPKNLYPITIPVYNVGVGIAQNCEVNWDHS